MILKSVKKDSFSLKMFQRGLMESEWQVTEPKWVLEESEKTLQNMQFTQ